MILPIINNKIDTIEVIPDSKIDKIKIDKITNNKTNTIYRRIFTFISLFFNDEPKNKFKWHRKDNTNIKSNKITNNIDKYRVREVKSEFISKLKTKEYHFLNNDISISSSYQEVITSYETRPGDIQVHILTNTGDI